MVAATGAFRAPYTPTVPGQEEFAERSLHAADYRTTEPFAGERVVVVGGGKAATRIAAGLGAVTETTPATLRPVGWMKQRPLGRDVHRWFKHTGFDTAPPSRLLERMPVSVLDHRRYRTALDTYGVERCEMFIRFTPDGVVWPDGAKESVDTILRAIGYRRTFSCLNGSGALDSDGRPRHHGGIATVPGLGFVGIEFQRSFS
ncbi:NAD(P)-binding domain-containing protein [Streptomyces sp. P9-A2]|uniref:NAD(P)-binding domain-containing protein n=1 Tax=Streptomyces sp. P9-A2 TaxID=3072284 RepID=UPI002FCAC3CA